MNNLLFILTLTVVCSIIEIQAASTKVIVAVADTSHTDSSYISRQFDLNSKTIQNVTRFSKFQNPYSDCIAIMPDSTYPGMKIFVPNPNLTASIHIFKPGIVDPGIFIPGGECFDLDRKN